jgi:hypothetical protein
VGKRTLRDARRLVLRLQTATDGYIPFFTSDALPHYADALLEVYGVCDTPPRRGSQQLQGSLSRKGFVMLKGAIYRNELLASFFLEPLYANPQTPLSQ